MGRPGRREHDGNIAGPGSQEALERVGHEGHLVRLFGDDLARAMLSDGERHAKLELTDVSLAKGDRPT